MIDDFLEWYRNDIHSDYEVAFSNEITKENLERMDREEFIEFFYQFARSGGNIQSGRH